MYRRHQAALDAPFVMQHLGHRGQAVGGARGVGHNALPGVARVVDAIHKHGRVVFAGCRQNDFFGTGCQVFFAGGLVQKQAGGFNHHIGADRVPLQVGRVALLRQAYGFAVDDQRAVFDRYLTGKAAMHAVVAQHIGQVIRLE